nr:hypothetical protein [Tanacetum cinerariifolium]
MSRDVLTVGTTMRILLLYQGEYSQWVERFMNYLEEQTDGEAMINSIKKGDQLLPHVTQYANKKQEFVKTDDKKVKKKADGKKRDTSRVKYYNCKKEGHFAKDYKKSKVKDYEYYKTKMLLAKKDKDKQNQGDVNDAMGSKKKTVVVTFDPLALIAEKINVSRSK